MLYFSGPNASHKERSAVKSVQAFPANGIRTAAMHEWLISGTNGNTIDNQFSGCESGNSKTYSIMIARALCLLAYVCDVLCTHSVSPQCESYANGIRNGHHCQSKTVRPKTGTTALQMSNESDVIYGR